MHRGIRAAGQHADVGGVVAQHEPDERNGEQGPTAMRRDAARPRVLGKGRNGWKGNELAGGGAGRSATKASAATHQAGWIGARVPL